MKDLNIKIQDSSKVSDDLVTYKQWFNGLKKFFTVKILPPKR